MTSSQGGSMGKVGYPTAMKFMTSKFTVQQAVLALKGVSSCSNSCCKNHVHPQGLPSINQCRNEESKSIKVVN